MMKTHFKLFITAFILSTTLVFSQSVKESSYTKGLKSGNIMNQKTQSIEGRLSVKGLPRSKTIKQKTPVDLFKAFKDGVYSLNFSFESTNSEPKGIVLFDMKTTIEYNGKIISRTSRDGWPWLPGDMFVPIEAFDVIPSLQKLTGNGYGGQPGYYKITLQIVPSEGQKVRGSISPTTMKFTIK